MPIAASNGTFSEPARTDGYHDMSLISDILESELPDDLASMNKDELIRLCQSLQKHALEVQASQKVHQQQMANYYAHYEDYKKNLFKTQSELHKYKFLYEEEMLKNDTMSDGCVGQKPIVRFAPSPVTRDSEMLPPVRQRRSLSESMSEENNPPIRAIEDPLVNTRRTHSTNTQEFTRLSADGEVHDSAEMPDLLTKLCHHTESMYCPIGQDFQTSLASSKVFLEMGQSFSSVSTQTDSSSSQNTSKLMDEVNDEKQRDQKEPTECSGMLVPDDFDKEMPIAGNKDLDKVKKRYSLSGLFKRIKSRGRVPFGSEETLRYHKPEVDKNPKPH